MVWTVTMRFEMWRWGLNCDDEVWTATICVGHKTVEALSQSLALIHSHGYFTILFTIIEYGDHPTLYMALCSRTAPISRRSKVIYRWPGNAHKVVRTKLSAQAFRMQNASKQIVTNKLSNFSQSVFVPDLESTYADGFWNFECPEMFSVRSNGVQWTNLEIFEDFAKIYLKFI